LSAPRARPCLHTIFPPPVPAHARLHAQRVFFIQLFKCQNFTIMKVSKFYNYESVKILQFYKCRNFTILQVSTFYSSTSVEILQFYKCRYFTTLQVSIFYNSTSVKILQCYQGQNLSVFKLRSITMPLLPFALLRVNRRTGFGFNSQKTLREY
jgi:hypothetical protein